ncbi:flagellin [Pueribacillus sp. YX66]|uniref:flagellin N-terminal helical domain-containing protein n=1 Tax=Pueribacillus sp. YX66 TaxID=3229242 RepID=UPI00358D5F91
MIINHNISALNAHRQLGVNNNAVAKSLEKLSSGMRINRAGDDAAGLAISEKMRGQIRGLEMASKNAQDGISLIQTAEGALNETHAILQRMRELAVQAANDTNEDTVDRAALQAEVVALIEEIDGITERTEFNTQTLLDGTFTGKIFHIGANKDQNLTVSIDNMDAESLGVGTVSIGTQADANNAIETINDALNTVSTQRSALGAIQNRLEHTINNLGASAENLTAAESRIRDTDMAKEMMEFTKNNILTQAAQAMLAQAQQVPQGVLQLLR